MNAGNTGSRRAEKLVGRTSLSETLSASQQRKTISGKVVDNTGEPVIGATVMEPGTNNGAVTDLDGLFSLEVSENATILVSCIGFADQTISTGNRSNFTIVLNVDNQLLEEVVVTAFATQKRVNVTGAITAVKGDDILQAPVANVSSALVGITPGLSAITTSGEPGQDAANIAIRGISSYSGSTSPLIVIDGIEQPESQAMSIMNSLNPNDILGISVLKDASSTAVYGIRAANGVIIITTRRGQEGRPKVSFSGNFGLTSATNLQKGLSSYEYALFRNEAINNEIAFNGAALSNYLFTEDDLWKFQNNRDFTPAEVEAMNLSPEQKEKLLNSPALYYGSSDAYSELYSRVAPQWQANVSVSGGTERVKYYVSLNYFDQQSIMQNANYFGIKTGSRYQRYNVRANIDIDLFKNTTLSVNTSGQYGVTKGPGTGSLYSRYSGIMQIIYEGNPFLNRALIMDDKLITDFDYPVGSVQYNLRQRTNAEMTGSWLPTLLGRSLGTNTNTRVDVTMRLRHDMSYLLKGLYAQASVRYQENFTRTVIQSFAIPSYTVRRSQTDPNVYEYFGGTVGADSFDAGSWGGMRDFYMDASLNWQGNFGKHTIGALALFRATKYTMPYDDFHTPSGLIGTSARVTYDYDTRYMAEINFAYNGTENFAKGKRFGFFPAFSLGWVISNEPFYGDNLKKVLSNLKIKATYGLVGNDRISNLRFPYLTIIEEKPDGTPWGGSGVLTENRVGADNLMWEKAKKFDVGMDLHLFGGQFTMTIDYFRDRREGIFQQRAQIPDYVGVITMPYGNVGSMTSWAIGRYVPHRVPANDAIDRLRRWGAPGLALAWVPVIGDVLPLAAGWLRIGFWPALLWTAAGKTARYSVMALALLGVF